MHTAKRWVKISDGTRQWSDLRYIEEFYEDHGPIDGEIMWFKQAARIAAEPRIIWRMKKLRSLFYRAWLSNPVED